jgi:aquaporin Z
MFERARDHWPEYVMEAAGLGLFMVSAAGFASLLEHPASSIRQAIADPLLRRMLMGCAMGLTAIAIVYSPMGARSGAHINPATTLTFFRLGRMHRADAAGYIAAQFAGGLVGILIAVFLFAPWIAAPSVNYVATLPGPWSEAAAFGAETLITFLLMTIILNVSNRARFARYTGLCAGAMVATYICVEAPISGMSMNPARSLGPALLTGELLFCDQGMGIPDGTYLVCWKAGCHRIVSGSTALCSRLHA